MAIDAGSKTRKQLKQLKHISSITTPITISNKMLNEEEEVIPNDVDVLCGSGNVKATHPGNQRFRRIVAKHYAEYANSLSKAEKMRVSRKLMKEVLSAGTRFLKKDSGSASYWYVANIRVGKDKMSHCLRDLRSKEGKRNAWAGNRLDSPASSGNDEQQATGPPPPPPQPALCESQQQQQQQQQHNKPPEDEQQQQQLHWNERRPVAERLVPPPAFTPPRSSSSKLVQEVTRTAARQYRARASAAAAAAAGSSKSLLRDAAAPAVLPVPWGHSSAGSVWEAQQQEAQLSQNPLLLEFATAFSDNQQLSQYDTGASQKARHYGYPIDRGGEAAQWYPPSDTPSARIKELHANIETGAAPHRNRHTPPSFHHYRPPPSRNIMPSHRAYRSRRPPPSYYERPPVSLQHDAAAAAADRHQSHSADDLRGDDEGRWAANPPSDYKYSSVSSTPYLDPWQPPPSRGRR